MHPLLRLSFAMNYRVQHHGRINSNPRVDYFDTGGYVNGAVVSHQHTEKALMTGRFSSMPQLSLRVRVRLCVSALCVEKVGNYEPAEAANFNPNGRSRNGFCRHVRRQPVPKRYLSATAS